METTAVTLESFCVDNYHVVFGIRQLVKNVQLCDHEPANE